MHVLKVVYGMRCNLPFHVLADVDKREELVLKDIRRLMKTRDTLAYVARRYLSI